MQKINCRVVPDSGDTIIEGMHEGADKEVGKTLYTDMHTHIYIFLAISVYLSTGC